MINIQEHKSHLVAVFGLGKSGLSLLRAFKKAHIHVLAWDDQEETRNQAHELGYDLVPYEKWDWKNLKSLYLSPGIPHHLPTPHAVAQQAKEHNVPILCDIDLLMRSCPEATYFGITGTNGKSTTTSLVGHLLKDAGKIVEVGGNIGVPVLDLKALSKDENYVLELSSYHLERIEALKLDYVGLVNITPDHLERHGGMDGYVEAKKRAFNSMASKLAVIGIDEKASSLLYNRLLAEKKFPLVPISCQDSVLKGVYVRDGLLVDSFWEKREVILDLTKLSYLRGVHNWQNAAVAYALCRAAGCRVEDLMQGLSSFKGLAHRLEVLGEIEGVQFVNDSKATNVDAAGKALACFDNIYWILGGRAKDDSLDALEVFYPKVKHAYLIGEAQEAFARTLKGRVPFKKCGTLENAIEQAYKESSQTSDKGVVLLSPACTSFDQFKNFEERGEKFRELFYALQKRSSHYKKGRI
jgi:UDP-N-acetylmuramoylalanine--D-glutamate ligase